MGCFANASPATVSGFHAIIHLAGETIAGRWTDSKKQRILDTRVQGTRNLAQAAAQAEIKPKAFISASAIGYYGNRGDEVLKEDSGSGNGFLAEVCRQWEGATRAAADVGIRTVHPRFGLVLSKRGERFRKCCCPSVSAWGDASARGGNGGVGSPSKIWWRAILHALNQDLHGAINVASPNPVTNAKFHADSLDRVIASRDFPDAAFAARLAFGQMGEELLLASQRVSPAKLQASNYQFRFTELKRCLESLLNKTGKGGPS